MTLKIIRRALATEDCKSAAEFLERHGSTTVAHDFSSALQTSLAQIADCPNIGLRTAFGPNDLCVWPLHQFSSLIFYIPHDDHIDVARILHAARDVPREFASSDDAPEDS